MFLKNATVTTTPFPHVIQKNSIEPSLFRKLTSTFPDHEWFDRNRKNIWGGGRVNLGRGNPVFEEFIQTEDAWRCYYEYINSPEFIFHVIELFRPYIKPYGPKIDLDKWAYCDYQEPLWKSGGGRRTPTQYYAHRLGLDNYYDSLMYMLRKNQLYVTFDIAQAEGGYHIPVHTDNRYKFFAILVYFNEISGSGMGGGELQVHRHKQNLPHEEYPRYPGEENTEVVGRIHPSQNLGVALLNCNNSYHSTTPFNTLGEPRKFLYIGMCQRHTHTIWNSRTTTKNSADARGL